MKHAIQSAHFPELLHRIIDPPDTLYVRGTLPPKDATTLGIIGSPWSSRYGRIVCEEVIRSLSSYPVSIVAGLESATDATAHQVALSCGIHTSAVASSGLSNEVLSPRQHRPLCKRIIKSNSCLISEYAPDTAATKESSIRKNRLIIGMAEAVFIPEATKRDAALVAARIAAEYNREVLVVPGDITKETSAGANALIADGATIVTSGADVARALGFVPETYDTVYVTETEQVVLDLLTSPAHRDTIRKALNCTESALTELLAVMETKGLIVTSLDTVSRAPRKIDLPNQGVSSNNR